MVAKVKARPDVGSVSKTARPVLTSLGKRNTGTSGGYDVTKDGKHRNTAVLCLYSAKSVESFLVGIGKKTKRIPESKRRLSTKSIFETHLEGRGSGNLGRRSEGSSRG